MVFWFMKCMLYEFLRRMECNGLFIHEVYVMQCFMNLQVY